MYWYKERPNYRLLNEPVNLRARGLRMIIRKTFIVFFFMMLSSLFLYFFLSSFHHVDVKNLCFINIKHKIFDGNRKTILYALEDLKNEDFFAYMRVCTYVNTITEDYCYSGGETRKDIKIIRTDGCYIKGTKSIIIKPVLINRYADILRRKEAIIKYSTMSEEFWDQYDEET